jgi:hypothetical protein
MPITKASPTQNCTFQAKSLPRALVMINKPKAINVGGAVSMMEPPEVLDTF